MKKNLQVFYGEKYVPCQNGNWSVVLFRMERVYSKPGNLIKEGILGRKVI